MNHALSIGDFHFSVGALQAFLPELQVFRYPTQHLLFNCLNRVRLLLQVGNPCLKLGLLLDCQDVVGHAAGIPIALHPLVELSL